jgi:integrase
VLERRQQRRQSGDGRVFRRDGVPVRQWRTALRDACRKAGVPHRMQHDCRRTAARNLIRAGVPERIAMVLTGHKTRAVFDRYNIVNDQELLTAGERLVAYVARMGS